MHSAQCTVHGVQGGLHMVKLARCTQYIMHRARVAQCIGYKGTQCMLHGVYWCESEITSAGQCIAVQYTTFVKLCEAKLG